MDQRKEEPRNTIPSPKKRKMEPRIQAGCKNHSPTRFATWQSTPVSMEARFTPTRQTAGWKRPKIASIAQASRMDYIHSRLPAPPTRINSASKPSYSPRLGYPFPKMTLIIRDSDSACTSSSDTSLCEEYIGERMREVEEEYEQSEEEIHVFGKSSPASALSVREDGSLHSSSGISSYEEINGELRREMEKKDKLSQKGKPICETKYPSSALSVCEDASSCGSSGASLYEEYIGNRKGEVGEEDELFEERNNVLADKYSASTPSVREDASSRRLSGTALYQETIRERKHEMEEKDKLSEERNVSDSKCPASTPSVHEDVSARGATSTTSCQESAGDRKHEVEEEDELSKKEKSVCDDKCPLLSALQGTWTSSSHHGHVMVDLMWVYIRGQVHKDMLTPKETEWTWNGWTLKETEEDTLRWKKNGIELVWTRVNLAPRLQCTHFDLGGPKRIGPNAKRALVILKNKFVISAALLQNPNAELYGLEFTRSSKGVFASCLLLREPQTSVAMIVYIGARAQMEGFGIDEMMLEQVIRASAREPGYNKFNRFAALVSDEAPNPKLDWWLERNFTKDITEELGDANPFSNCSVLECEQYQSILAEKQQDEAMLSYLFPAPDAVPIFEGAPRHAQKESRQDTPTDVNQAKRDSLMEETSRPDVNRARRDNLLVLEETTRQREQLQREFEAYKAQAQEEEMEQKSEMSELLSTVSKMQEKLAALKRLVDDRIPVGMKPVPMSDRRQASPPEVAR
eukprot:GEMP01008953.1.p1 GENE.GEMP01008953.1~~GEMP01008953.1.p1  ORF type:complete len:746 (+),score=143.85 GEMP01008953.1:262-2499(+)